MTIRFLLLLILLAAAGLLAPACSAIPGPSPADATPTPLPTVIVDTNVVAEGRLAPRESVQLSFSGSGHIVEVLVQEGDLISAGDIVARLGSREELESAIASAEHELLTAQQTLLSLEEDLPEAQTGALQAVSEARDALRDAEQKLRGFDVAAEDIDIEVARANVALAEKALKEAQKKYKPYANKPESNLKRAAWLNKVADAQERYDDAVRQLNRLTGVITPAFELEQAQTELSIAQARLEQAREQNDLLQDGPDPDDTAAAEAQIRAAEAALASARAALANLDLTATIDGTVVEHDLIAGQQINAGEPMMTIADFSQMYVETDDLTEIEVVEISEGQKAEIIPDALPDVRLTGTVERISQVSEEKRGDITYTARILLDEVDPRLRWGMTVEVTFQK